MHSISTDGCLPDGSSGADSQLSSGRAIPSGFNEHSWPNKPESLFPPPSEARLRDALADNDAAREHLQQCGFSHTDWTTAGVVSQELADREAVDWEKAYNRICDVLRLPHGADALRDVQKILGDNVRLGALNHKLNKRLRSLQIIDEARDLLCWGFKNGEGL
jgi:hypothetical protein